MSDYGFTCQQNLASIIGEDLVLENVCCATCMKKKSCKEPQYKGDGNCDDGNNNKACSWDGGDCCPKTVSGGAVKTQYCKKVSH